MIPIPAVSSLIPKLYTITKLRAPRRSRIGSGADCGAASRGATHERDDCGASDSTASWRGSDVYLVRPRAAMLYAAAQAPRRPAARASGTARQRCLQQRGGGSTSSTTCGREGEGGGGTSMAPQPRPCGACKLLVASPAEGRNPSLFVPDVESGPSRRDESWAKSTAAPPRTTNRKDAVLWPVPASGDSPTERWEDERHGKRSRARSARGHGVVCAGERAAAARWQRPDGG